MLDELARLVTCHMPPVTGCVTLVTGRHAAAFCFFQQGLSRRHEGAEGEENLEFRMQSAEPEKRGTGKAPLAGVLAFIILRSNLNLSPCPLRHAPSCQRADPLWTA